MATNKPPSTPPPQPNRPKTKEDALRELLQKDPEKAAQILKEILKGK